MAETETMIEPYENTLDIPDLRRELRRAWDELASIRKDLRDMPEVPTRRMLNAFITSSSWLSFEDAFSIGKQMQRAHGLGAIPPKCEYELAAAHYKFIRDAIMEKLEREGVTRHTTEGKGETG